MARNCDVCQKPYEAKRPSSKFCSDTCRQRAKRSPGVVTPIVPLPTPSVALDAGAVYAATLGALIAVDQQSSPLGTISLAMASRMDASTMDTGSSFAALARELRASLAAALDDAVVVDDPLDQVKQRRDAQRA